MAIPQPSASHRPAGLHPETEIAIAPWDLRGSLVHPAPGQGLVVFAHGSGSSRLSPRNQRVAKQLQRGGFGTLLFDLLSEGETADRRNVFDVPLLAERLVLATEWVRSQEELKDVPLGYFGASTGAAAALAAAALTTHPVAAIVSRGGRPDLAGPALPLVRAATLLLVGGKDHDLIELNKAAYRELTCKKEVSVVPGAGHLFEEPGTLDMVTALAQGWFMAHLGTARAP